MENRLHLENNTHFIEELNNEAGRERLQLIRKTYKEFKGRRIKSIIQVLPETIILGKFYMYRGYTYAIDQTIKPTMPRD